MLVIKIVLKGAHAALVCYSVMDDSSFKSLDDWLKKLDDNRDKANMIKFIIGNKSDVEKHERRVDIKTGKAYAEQRQL